MPYSWLAGREYRLVLRQCRQVDRLSRPEVLACQEKKLGELLDFAVEQVPFYRKYRSVVGRLTPRDALKELPLVTKEDVQQHFAQLRAEANVPCHRARTSGTSGNQLAFYEDDTTYAREMGYMHSQWQRIGYSPDSRKAVFRDVVIQSRKPGIYWQQNPIHNELRFSPFHMNEANLPLYFEKLVEYQPDFLHGYPSAIDILAEYVLRIDGQRLLSPVQGALLGSEGCSAVQRERIAEAFHTRVFTWYGHSERAVLGGECECSRAYHSFPTYGILEIVREDGTPCEIGERGEIVGTGFLNRSMPLIRYRTGDHATRESPMCECGRCWDRFSNVIGRRDTDGCLVGKSGQQFSLVMLETPSHVFRNVIRFQYYQKKCGELYIRLMVNPDFKQNEETSIIEAHRKRLLGEMDINVEYVGDIPLTLSGKQRWIVSEMDPDRF